MANLRIWIACVICMFALAFNAAGGVHAQPDDQVYSVSGVKVDVSDVDAAQAKLKAISVAQVKAFRVLVQRLGREDALGKLSHLTSADIGRLMASLSIAQERTGPKRYIATLTINFLPDAVRALFAETGIEFTEKSAPATLIVPVWREGEEFVAWSDNPWRRAWLNLNAQGGLVPVIVPLGDLSDSQTITADQAAAGDRAPLEALMRRYDSEAVLVAIAEPRGDNSVYARMIGDAAVGKILIEKTYVATEGGIQAAANQAAERFHAVMLHKWKQDQAAPTAMGVQQRLSMAVPFETIDDWNIIRQMLLDTPGVTGVDIAKLSAGGAIVELRYGIEFPQLQATLQARGLNLSLVNGAWVLSSY